MNFHIVTLFPDAFSSYLGESIIKRAQEDKKIKIKFYNPRDFVHSTGSTSSPQAGSGQADKKGRVYPERLPRVSSRGSRRVDQKPYGGGPGMVIQALPVLKAVDRIKNKEVGSRKKVKIIMLTPRGKQFTNSDAAKLAAFKDDIVLISGRYEGIDARVRKILKPIEYSVGPYVLTGGELPAMVILDAVARRIPGVLGDEKSVEETRIASGDVYTRPETFVYKKKKYSVPKVLLSGHHKKIEEWRKKRRS